MLLKILRNVLLRKYFKLPFIYHHALNRACVPTRFQECNNVFAIIAINTPSIQILSNVLIFSGLSESELLKVGQ